MPTTTTDWVRGIKCIVLNERMRPAAESGLDDLGDHLVEQGSGQPKGGHASLGNGSSQGLKRWGSWIGDFQKKD